MSEVYIRSQNKEKLYRLGGNYACVEYGEYEDVKKKRAGVYINSIDAESYETETGYWLVPITVEILKEE